MVIPYIVPGIIVRLTRKPDEDGNGACGSDGSLVAVKATLLFSLLKNVARQLLLVSAGMGRESGRGREGKEGEEEKQGKEESPRGRMRGLFGLLRHVWTPLRQGVWGILIREIYNVDYLCNRVRSGERVWGVVTRVKRSNSRELLASRLLPHSLLTVFESNYVIDLWAS